MSKVKGFLTKFKLTYVLYNVFQWRKLRHNIRLYRLYGIKMNYFSSISSKDFKGKTDKVQSEVYDKVNLKTLKLYEKLTDDSKESLKNYDQNGYAILRSYLSDKEVDGVNKEIDNLLESEKIGFRYRNKIMFAIKKSDLLRRIGENPELIDLLSSLLKDKVKLFQSINFLMGSQQRAHSDSIHMTTYPLGGLLGVWIALEDIDNDNGPLFYYPGSHKLPYFLNGDYGNEGNTFLLGGKDYTVYEDEMQDRIQKLNLKKLVFRAKKGDLIIWHANLIHGGQPHLNKNKTRKSMVFHYFGEDYICYHEVTQRPALID